MQVNVLNTSIPIQSVSPANIEIAFTYTPNMVYYISDIPHID